MKNFKKIVAATMCGIMALTMTACSGGKLSERLVDFCEESSSPASYTIMEKEKDVKRVVNAFHLDVEDYDIDSLIKVESDKLTVGGECFVFTNDEDSEDFYEDLVDYKTEDEGIEHKAFTCVVDGDDYTFIAYGSTDRNIKVNSIACAYIKDNEVFYVYCMDYQANYDGFSEMIDELNLENPVEVDWVSAVEDM